MARPTAPTSRTGPKRCTPWSRWRPPGPARSSSARTSARSRAASGSGWRGIGCCARWVFQFESTPDAAPPRPACRLPGTLGTHDLPRFGAYLWGDDIDERERPGRVDARAGGGGAAAERDQWRRQLLDGLGTRPESGPGGGDRGRPARAAWTTWPGATPHIVLVDLEELWGERRPRTTPAPDPRRQLGRPGARTFEDSRSDQALGQPLAGSPLSGRVMTIGMRHRRRFPGAGAITDEDVYWFNEGTHRQPRLASSAGTSCPTAGARFAVWAPNATRGQRHR